jgi:hypothetical protein
MPSLFWDIDDAMHCRWVVGCPATRLILSPASYDDFQRSLSSSGEAPTDPVITLHCRYGDLTVETNDALPAGSWTVV